MKNEKQIEVRHLGITVKVTREKPSRYVIPDYTSGRRVRRVCTSKASAKEKAKEICEILARGKTEERTILSDQDLRQNIRNAIEILRNVGMEIRPGAELLAKVLKIIPAPELEQAVQFYSAHRPDKPFTPKNVASAVDEFLLAQKAVISPRRHQTLNCYLGQFKNEFGGKQLHEIRQHNVEAFLETKRWSPKTHNDFLNMVGLMYKYGNRGNRHWVSAGYSPSNGIERKTETEDDDVALMKPDDAKQMLTRIDPELIPFLVLWCFTGCRKEEAGRVTWEQIHAALRTGELELRKDQTKNGRARRRRGARKMPLLPNARAWIEWWLLRFGPRETGLVLPLRWNTLSQLSEMTTYIVRNTGIVWQRNGPRRSFISYRCKIT